jgi:hypothetical protein
MSAVDGKFLVSDVVTAALRKSGIIGLGQTPNGSDVLDAQNDLSDMLAQWNVKTWLVWDKVDIGFTATGQNTPYTIGPGGNYNVVTAPDRIEAAYVQIIVQSGLPVSQPLKVIPSREEYSRIALKGLVAYPKAVFYDSSSPVGNLYFYPWPTGSLYIMNIVAKNIYPLILPLTTSLAGLPPASRAAMKFCLARRLRQGYGKGLRPDPELNALAKDALTTMRNSQIQVPELVLPSALLRPSHYNIYSDQTYAFLFGVALTPILWQILHLGGLFT